MAQCEPWRCPVCNAFIYNRDRDGYPEVGAPKPLYFNHQYPKVCMTCFQLGVNIRDNTYWKAQSDKYYERLKKALGGET